jgi:hypothetical protein
MIRGYTLGRKPPHRKRRHVVTVAHTPRADKPASVIHQGSTEPRPPTPVGQDWIAVLAAIREQMRGRP